MSTSEVALNGLQQLQQLMASGKRPGIGVSLDFTLVEIETGRAVFEGTPGLHAYNPIGSVHGGYAATLLDSACGCAVHASLSAQQAYTTLELKIAYHKGMTKETGPVRAEGRILTLSGLALVVLATLSVLWPRVVATPLAILAVWLGLALMWRSFRLVTRHDDPGPTPPAP